MTFPFSTLVVIWIGALLGGGLAIFVAVRAPRAAVRWSFSVGMIALAAEAVLTGLSVQALSPEELIRWQRLRVVAAAFLPGSWLLFSLSFARARHEGFVRTWKWVTTALYLLPLALVTVFGNSLFLAALVPVPSAGWVLYLGRSGYLFHLLSLLGAVLILVNLERTLRASTGGLQWQIKFMVLGVGSLFAIRIYTYSQALLFSAVDMRLETVHAIALLVADGLICLSLSRDSLMKAEFYLSQTFLYRSLTVSIVGIYLLTVGVLAKATIYLHGVQALPLVILFVFLALLGLTVILLSDRWQQRIRAVVSRHLYRPHYDYRYVWATFTRRTSALVTTRDLCTEVAKMVSEMFGVANVTIWSWDDTQEHLAVGGSTGLSEAQVYYLTFDGKSRSDIIGAMRAQEGSVDFDQSHADWARALRDRNQDAFQAAEIRYGIPLVAGKALLGLMTLSQKVTAEPLTAEDFDLLKTLADQAAGSLGNLQLAQRLVKAKQLEAFHALSAFFIHDLKNLASTLSMTMQNLPAHFDDPAFRQDAQRAISRSVARLNTMCGRLSLVGQTLELQRIEADLNDLVTVTLAGLNGCLKVSPMCDLTPVPRLSIDSEQIQKVLTNLILNAGDAVGTGGEIRVTTEHRDGLAVLSVSDNGCGMSHAFMERSLFQPFQTTKTGGLGIGLFHCKQIVEAHGGSIEVESEEGKGSTFRVILPTNGQEAGGRGQRAGGRG